MGAQCCKQEREKPLELVQNFSIVDSGKIINISPTFSAELNKEEIMIKTILYTQEPFKISVENLNIKKAFGDADELIPLSLRSLDSDSHSQPDDSKTKKTILKHDLHYVAINNTPQNNKKRVRFDLPKR